MITHYDLFAGIGGFSLALEEVFHDETIKHIFCEWEPFPTSVLKQHWPKSEFWGDIADLVAHTDQRQSRPGIVSKPDGETQLERSTARTITGNDTHTQHARLERSSSQGSGHLGQPSGERPDQAPDWTILTGGFPCQPFSAAGRRKGTADDRYQWPNMLEVIRNTKPDWVIAENVRGLVTWNEGLVLETICTDLEAEGYEVQPFIIPAVSVGAPHRRDRVWIIAHNSNASSERWEYGGHNRKRRQVLPNKDRSAKEDNSTRSGRDSRSTKINEADSTDARGETSTDSRPSRRESRSRESIQPECQESKRSDYQYPDWQRNWQEVAFATCDDAMDDGLSRLVDGIPYSRAKWRKDSLKAYGNGIVPQLAIEIMKALSLSVQQLNTGENNE